MGGYSATAKEEARSIRDGDVLLLLLDAADVEAWIAAADRAAWLVARIQEAVVRP